MQIDEKAREQVALIIQNAIAEHCSIDAIEMEIDGAGPASFKAADRILAYESAKQKGEAEGRGELAAACPTIVKAGKKLTADRVSGKVVVGCYGDVPAAEFKRLAAMLSAGGEG